MRKYSLNFLLSSLKPKSYVESDIEQKIAENVAKRTRTQGRYFRTSNWPLQKMIKKTRLSLEIIPADTLATHPTLTLVIKSIT
jgi:hypothetical protein